MNIFELVKNGGYKSVPNPDYNPKSKKNKVSPTILVPDISGTSFSGRMTSGINKAMQQSKSMDYNTFRKFENEGLTPNFSIDIDKELANMQSTGEKYWNAAKQAVVGEMLIGIPKGFSDIFDFCISGLNNDDNDYTNPVSSYLADMKKSYEEANPIYKDPELNVFNGGLTDAGWIASNLPSTASTISLMIPGIGVTKALSFLGEASGLTKLVGFTRRSLTGLRNFDKLSKAKQLDKMRNLSSLSRFVNTTGKRIANDAVKLGINSAAMRIAENYQEAQQTYQSMYEQAAQKFNEMNDEEWSEYIDKHQDLLGSDKEGNKINPNDREAVARRISNKAANTTFNIDLWNFFFDFIELKSLQNVGKLAKNVKNTFGSRRAERLLRKQLAKEAGLLTEEESKSFIKNTLTSVKDFAKDAYPSATALAGEISEGLEEAVNYIAQEEGMHYGNTMLTDMPYTSFNNRLKSYLNSPELYDAAFWGFMGGVLFQTVGGKVQQVANNTFDKAISSINNNSNNRNKEKSSTWSELWEDSTTKRQKAEIENRMHLAEEARAKLDDINNGKNPFETESDNRTLKTINSEGQEADLLRDRVVDEYITKLTMNAIDVGSYNRLVDFMQDEAVDKKLREMGLVSEDTNKKDVVAKMQQVAKDYERNLLTVETLSSSISGGIPMEYLQIIARDNTVAEYSIQNLQNRIDFLKQRAATTKDQYSQSLLDAGFDPNADYLNNIELVEASNRLGSLKAQRKAIMEDEEHTTAEKQETLRFLNRQIEAIEEKLTSNPDVIDNILNMIWASGTASMYKFDTNTGRVVTDSASDEHVKFTDLFTKAITTKSKDDVLALIEHTGKKFEVTDEDIVKLFGNPEDKNDRGLYAARSEQIYQMYPSNQVNESEKISKTLKQVSPLYYQYLAEASNLEIAKIYNQALLANTIDTISIKKQELDNSMNEARKKALNKAYEVLDRLEEKYGAEPILQYLSDNRTPANINDGDKRLLSDAADIINLQNEANASLYNEIQFRFLDNHIQRAKQKKIDELNSTTNSEEISATETQPTIETSSEQLETNTEQNSIETEPTNEQPLTEEKHGKYEPVVGIDGTLKVTPYNEDDFQGYTYSEDVNGNVILNIDNVDNLDDTTFDRLFDVEDTTSSEDTNLKREIVDKPVLHKDDNDNWSVVKKGLYRISSTGEVSETNTPKVVITETEEGQIDIGAENRKAFINNLFQNAFRTLAKDEELKKPENITKRLAAARRSVEAELNTLTDEDKEYLNDAIQIIADAAQRRGLDVNLSDVILKSSVTEDNEVEYNDYVASVDKMLKDYVSKYNLPVINGKIYVNLENLLRSINEDYNNKDVASFIYSNLVNYIQSKLGKDKYVITGLNPNSSNFLSEVRKSLQEKLATTVITDGSYRVDIDSALEDKSASKVFSKLKAGDKLQVEKTDKEIFIKANGKTIGRIPAIEVTNDGAYKQVNLGWITTILENGDIIESELKDTLINLVTSKETRPLFEKILEYTYDTTLSNDNKKALATLIGTELRSKYGKFITKDAQDTELVDFISHLCKYLPGSTYNERVYKVIDKSIDNFFRTLLESYKFANKLMASDENSYEITVDNTRLGEKNENQLIPNQSNYHLYNNLNEALSDDIKKSGEIQIGFIEVESQGLRVKGGNIAKEDGKDFNFNIKSKGIPFVIIPNGTSKAFCIGTSTRFNDKSNATFAKMSKAIVDELNYRLKDLETSIYDEKKWNSVIDLLYQVCGNRVKNWSVNADLAKRFSRITPLFKGCSWWVTNGNYIHFSINDNTSIELNNNGKFKVTQYNSDTKTYTNTEYNINESTGIQAFREQLNKLFTNPKLGFNISDKFIDETRIQEDEYGKDAIKPLYQADGNGHISVTIPNSDSKNNHGKPFHIEADGFTNFAMEVGVLKVNTFVKDGSNFNVDTNIQRANRNLRVRMTSKTTSPVEETKITVTNSETEVRQILTDNNVDNKAERLIEKEIELDKEHSLSQESLNTLKELDLLPKILIFDEELNGTTTEDGVIKYTGDNAVANIETKEVRVGNRFVSMYSETGEFAGTNGANRMQAIRKLIHEQLHLRLHSRGNEKFIARIEEIYNDFKKSIDNIEDEALKARMTQYLFNDESKEIALEEFLVESLTSKELVDYLNSVEVKFEKGKLKKNLFQKILQALSDIFGWNVKENSLREKELYALQEEIAKIEKEVKKQESKTLKEHEVKQESIDEFNIFDIIVDGNNELGSSITESIYSSEMQDIKNKALSNGTFMKAPNGNPTNLNERQWLQVRTKAFKDWFGDWINNPNEASKAVDENGEPRVMYHGSPELFDTFSYDFFGRTDPGDNGRGFYFAYRKGTAKGYGDNIYPVFLNVKHPFIHTGFNTQTKVRGFNRDYNPTNREILQKRIDSVSRKIELDKESLEEYKEDEFHISILNKRISYNQNLLNNLQQELITKSKDYLDLKLYDTLDEYDGVMEQDEHYQIVVRNPNQVKSAIYNNGNFSTTDDNIYHSSITESVAYPISNVNGFIASMPLEKQGEFLRRIEQGEEKILCTI